jgi:hypothetical protein
MIAFATILLAAGYNVMQTLAVGVLAAGGGAIFWAGKEIFHKEDLPTLQNPNPEPFSWLKVVSAVAVGAALVVAGAILFGVSQGRIRL